MLAKNVFEKFTR